jgi:hypothetical protein
MSLYALSWAFAQSQTGGNDRLVMFVLAHHADEGGFSGASRATMAQETRLSESTIKRSLDSILSIGEIARVDGNRGPAWWKDIPVNRRPSLYALTGFLGGQFDPPKGFGVSLGVHRGFIGDQTPPSDQARRDVNSLSLELTNLAASRVLAENDKAPDLGCLRCRGSGQLFGASEPRRCSCTYIADPGLALADLNDLAAREPEMVDSDVVAPPWVAEGVSCADWVRART